MDIDTSDAHDPTYKLPDSYSESSFSSYSGKNKTDKNSI